MQLSVEISLYPLSEQYLDVIESFVERLAGYENISVHTNTISTHIFGDFASVMAILTKEFEYMYQQDLPQLFVCKFINRDLKPHG